jgi:putative ABC transport system ATP-binding protein
MEVSRVTAVQPSDVVCESANVGEFAVEGRGLYKSYRTADTAVRALDGVDIAVARGEFVAIMGPSGSGKSTLLHVLGALDSPDAGEVAIAGRSLANMTRDDLALVRRREVGFVFQFFNLVPVLTLEENVALPASLDGRRRGDPHGRVDELLELLEIADRRDKLPSQLSGGEQQRTAIARALVNEPSILLADEPTGNLDHVSGMQVMTMFRKLNDAGRAIVVVTHDPGVASFAQRVVFVRDGRIVDETTDGDRRAVLERLVGLEG